MTETNKTPKTSRTRGTAKGVAEEKLVVPGQNNNEAADVHPEEQKPQPIAATDLQGGQEPLDDGLTAEERAVLNGETSSSEPLPNGNGSADPESRLDPKAMLLSLASSEIQGFGSNFAESVITSAQENSKMAAEMIRQYPQLFYILTLQQLTEAGFTGAEGGKAVDMGKPHLTVLPGGMESGYQQFQTLMSQAQRTVLSALPGTVLKQLSGQEAATQ